MLRLRDLAFLDEQTHASFPASEIRSGDVLLNITGASIGRSAVATDALDGGNVNQHVCEIRLDKRQMNPMFVCQILLSRLGQRQIASSQAGGNRQGLNFRQVGSITVPEPRLGEQRAMAAALSDADALIATLERLIGKKEAIKQGMMQQLFAGETRLAGFSGLWRSMDFEALASPVKQRTDPQLVPANTPLIELEQMGSGSGRLLALATAREAISLKTVFRPGDVLFGKLRAYLRKFWLANTAGICSTEIWALRPTRAATGSFIRYLVETERFIEAASGSYGTHMPRSDWRMLRRLAFEVPPVKEQEAIASALQEADYEIGVLLSRLTKTKSIKQGMMQQLLTGRTRLPVMEEEENP